MESDDVYVNLPQFDFNEEIEKLKSQNQLLQSHIESLEKDIEKLCQTLVDMKTTQSNLEKNISELFNTARREIERKDQMIADLRTKFDNLILRRQGINRARTNENRISENDVKRPKHEENGRYNRDRHHSHHNGHRSSSHSHRKSRNHDELRNGNNNENRSVSRESRHGDRSDKEHNRRYDRHERDKSKRGHIATKKEDQVEEQNRFKCSIDLKDAGLEQSSSIEKDIVPTTFTNATKNLVEVRVEKSSENKSDPAGQHLPKPTVFTQRVQLQIDDSSKKLLENIERVVEQQRVRDNSRFKENFDDHKHEKSKSKSHKYESDDSKRSRSVPNNEKSSSHSTAGARSISVDHSLENRKKHESLKLHNGVNKSSHSNGLGKTHHKGKTEEAKKTEKTSNNKTSEEKMKNRDEPRDRSKENCSSAKSSAHEKRREEVFRDKNTGKHRDKENFKRKNTTYSLSNKDLKKIKRTDKNLIPVLPKYPPKSSENEGKGTCQRLTHNNNLILATGKESFLAAESQRSISELIQRKQFSQVNLESPGHNQNDVASSTNPSNNKEASVVHLEHVKTFENLREIPENSVAVMSEVEGAENAPNTTEIETLKKTDTYNNNTQNVHEPKIAKSPMKQPVEKRKREEEPAADAKNDRSDNDVDNQEIDKAKVIGSVMAQIKKKLKKDSLREKKYRRKADNESVNASHHQSGDVSINFQKSDVSDKDQVRKAEETLTRRVLRSATRKQDEIKKVTPPSAPQSVNTETIAKSPLKTEKSAVKRRVIKMTPIHEIQSPCKVQHCVMIATNEDSLPVLHIPDTDSNFQDRAIFNLSTDIDLPKNIKIDESSGLKIVNIEPHASAEATTPVCILQRLEDGFDLDQLRDDLHMSSFEQSSSETPPHAERARPKGDRKKRRVILQPID